MALDRVDIGERAPDEFNVIVEIPMQGPPIKYEIDKETGALFVDRFIQTAMYYPYNYGYIPSTLGNDGDPVDSLIISHYPVVPGAVIKCRAIGILFMQDESGDDEKIIAVPTGKIDASFAQINSLDDLNDLVKSRIVHFFENYKDLEPGKWVKIKGWGDAEEAKKIIMSSLVSK